MSDRNNNLSLDDMLKNIRLEREIKAGITPSSDEPVKDEPEKETASQAQPEPKVQSSSDEPEEAPQTQRKFDYSVEDLLSAYLTEDELKQNAQKEQKATKKEPQKASKPKSSDNNNKQEVEKPETKADEPKPDKKEELPEEDPLLALFGDNQDEDDSEKEKKLQEQEKIRHRRKRINDFRKFTEKMQDEALLDIEEREKKQAKIKADIYDNIEPLDGEDLFHAVDEVEVSKKNRASIKFNLFNSPAKTAEQKAQQENLNKTVLSVKEQKKQLESMRQKASLSALLSGVIAGVLLVLAVLPEFYEQGGFLESFIGGTGRIYLSVNLAMIVLSIVVSFDIISSSIKSLIKLSPNCDACVLIALFFAALHNLAMLLKGGFIANGGVLYNSAAVFALFFNCLTKLFSCSRILGNLSVLSKSRSLRCVQTIENRADANQLAHGLSLDSRPGILYSTESQLPEKFTSLSKSRKDEEHFFTYAIPIILVLSILAGVIGAITSKNVVGFITSYTGCLCICLPIGMTFISNFLIMKTNSTLNKSGGVILGFDSTHELEKANAVIMDSKDIVFAEVSNFHNIKTSYDMTLEQAVTYAGAVITKGRGVLAEVFDDIVKQLKINVPAVEDLKYEDRLGFSAWVNSVKVLVGNSDMMTQHNVELPASPEGETEDGRTTIYVAVEGKLAAAFNVTYHIGKNAAKQIKRLSKNGVVLMLLTTDPGITEEFVSKRADVSVDSIKIANSKCRDIMRMYRGTGPRKKNSNLIYKPSSGALLKLINSAYRLADADRQASVIQVISLIFAAGLCFSVNLFGTAYMVNSLSIVVYQLIWGFIACLIAGRTLNNY